MKQVFAIIAIIFIASSLSAQYIGGDFSASEDEKEKKYAKMQTKELLIELEEILNIAAVRGFRRGNVDCMKGEPRKYTLKAVSVLKKAILILPLEYSILVIGHADKTGPEVSEKGSRGNDYYSVMRAKCVSDVMIQRIPEAKSRILVGGHGSSRNQRMVSFQILEKEKARQVYRKLIRKYRWSRFKWN